jgi:hypothetical protein
VKVHVDDLPPPVEARPESRGTRQLGLRTGIDIDALVAARVIITEGWPAKTAAGTSPMPVLLNGFRYAGVVA